MMSNNNGYNKIGSITLQLMGVILFLIIFIFIVNQFFEYKVKEVILKEQVQIDKVIRNTINSQAKLNLLLPKIVFINADSTKNLALKDSILSQVSSKLTQYYLNNELNKTDSLNISSFFIFPDEKNPNGKYELTKGQLDDLRNHLIFLTNQVDKTIVETKEEINKEIGRLNNWISIWMGVLAIIGIFIPIIINIRSFEELKMVEQKADKAGNKSDMIIRQAKTIENKVDQIDKRSFTANKNSNEALVNSLVLEKLLKISNTMSKLKDIDPSVIQHTKTPVKVLTGTLKSLYLDFEESTKFFKNEIIISNLRELALRIQIISTYDFLDRKGIMAMNNFSLFISDHLNTNMTKDDFEKILLELSELIKIIGKNNVD